MVLDCQFNIVGNFNLSRRFSIKYVIKGIRDLRRAKYSKQADQSEALLNDCNDMAEEYGELLEKYKDRLADSKELLENERDNITPGLLDSLKEIVDNAGEVSKAQIDTLDNLRQIEQKGGLSGFFELDQIEATKNIALGAALMAGSGVFAGISSIIISIVIK